MAKQKQDHNDECNYCPRIPPQAEFGKVSREVELFGDAKVLSAILALNHDGIEYHGGY